MRRVSQIVEPLTERRCVRYGSPRWPRMALTVPPLLDLMVLKIGTPKYLSISIHHSTAMMLIMIQLKISAILTYAVMHVCTMIVAVHLCPLNLLLACYVSFSLPTAVIYAISAFAVKLNLMGISRPASLPVESFSQ